MKGAQPDKFLFWNILGTGLPREGDLEVLRKVVLLNLLSIAGAAYVLVFGLLNFARGYYATATADAIILGVVTFNFLYLRRTHDPVWISYTSTIAGMFFFQFLLMYGPPAQGTYMWSFSFPVIAIFLLGLRRGLWFISAHLALVLLFFVFGSGLEGVGPYPFAVKTRIVPAYLLITIFMVIMELAQNRLHEVVTKKRSKLKDQVAQLEVRRIEREELIERLQQNIKEVKVLQGFLPICASCKKIRDDEGYWNQLEHYLAEHTAAQVSYGICPDCATVRELKKGGE